jgi:hypothetical protein
MNRQLQFSSVFEPLRSDEKVVAVVVVVVVVVGGCYMHSLTKPVLVDKSEVREASVCICMSDE